MSNAKFKINFRCQASGKNYPTSKKIILYVLSKLTHNWLKIKQYFTDASILIYGIQWSPWSRQAGWASFGVAPLINDIQASNIPRKGSVWMNTKGSPDNPKNRNSKTFEVRCVYFCKIYFPIKEFGMPRSLTSKILNSSCFMSF
jgi:hypothetical protein